jgi:hypothetical protein
VAVLKAHSGQSNRGIPRLALDVLFGNVDEIFPSQLHHPRSNNGVIPLQDFGPQWSNFICCFLQFTNSEVNFSIKIESRTELAYELLQASTTCHSFSFRRDVDPPTPIG